MRQGLAGLEQLVWVPSLSQQENPFCLRYLQFQNRLLPEVHTKDETAYLELYKLAIEDGKITQKERTMLMMQAKVYGLQDKRVEHLEAWYKDNIASDDVIPNIVHCSKIK